MTFFDKSKASYSFMSLGIALGLIISYKKDKPIKDIALTTGLFGLAGYFIGNSITKLYE